MTCRARSGDREVRCDQPPTQQSGCNHSCDRETQNPIDIVSISDAGGDRQKSVRLQMHDTVCHGPRDGPHHDLIGIEGKREGMKTRFVDPFLMEHGALDPFDPRAPCLDRYRQSLIVIPERVSAARETMYVSQAIGPFGVQISQDDLQVSELAVSTFVIEPVENRPFAVDEEAPSEPRGVNLGRSVELNECVVAGQALTIR
jgi:hypothetical protein